MYHEIFFNMVQLTTLNVLYRVEIMLPTLHVLFGDARS